MPLKKVIALRGKKNSGKTKLVIDCYHWLKEHFSCEELLPNKALNAGLLTVVRTDNLKIAFCSHGTTEELIWRQIEVISKFKSDIIICSCNSYGNTIDAISGLMREGYKVDFLSVDEAGTQTFEDLKSTLGNLVTYHEYFENK